jgi:hypothetical protein
MNFGKTSMEKLDETARFDQVRAVKDLFSRELMSSKAVSGVGIGWNDTHSDLAVRIFVRNAAAASAIPRRRDGVDVCVTVAGNVSAL